MRLLVVCTSKPVSSFSTSPNLKIAPQPPGPGFPEQAPSVWMMTCGGELTFSLPSCENAIVADRGYALMEAQLAGVFERILRAHQSALRDVEKIDQSRQQKA